MKQGHLDRRWLEPLLSGASPSRESLEHLLSHIGESCETCRAEVQAAVAARDRARRPYEAEMRRVVRRVERRDADLLRQRATAEADLQELIAAQAGELRRRIQRGRRRFRNPFLVDLLLEESRRQVTVDPGRAYQLAQCAHELALSLSRELLGDRLCATLVARANAHRGNALRACGDSRRAEPILEFALDLFEREGTGDPLVWAELKTLLASLAKDRRRFVQAERHLEAALRIYQQHGVEAQLGRLLVKRGELYRDMGEPEKGVAAVEEALAHIDPESDPRLFLCAQHNLAHYLLDAGQLTEAQDLLATNRELYDRFPEAWTQLRRLWLTGKIDYRLGALRAAEEAFLAVRKGFLDEGLGLDAALAGLDLGLVWIALGKSWELARLAPEVALTFRSQGVAREAMAALLLFEEAARRETVTAQLIHALIQALRPEHQRPYELPA